MNIGLDFYGTITLNPPLYRALANFTMNAGGKVYIISAIRRKNLARLQKYIGIAKVPSTEVVPVFFDDYDQVPALKGDVAEKLKLDLYIDDRFDVCEELTARGVHCLLAVPFEEPRQ